MIWKRRQARADIHVASAAYVTVYTFTSEDDGARLSRCVLSLAQSDESDPSQITMLDLYRAAAVLQVWDIGNVAGSTLATPAGLYGSPQNDIPMDVIVRAGDLLRVYSAAIATAAAYVSVSLDLGAPPRVATEERTIPFPGCAVRGEPGRADLIGRMGVLGAIAGLLDSERGIYLRGWLEWDSIRKRTRKKFDRWPPIG